MSRYTTLARITLYKLMEDADHRRRGAIDTDEVGGPSVPPGSPATRMPSVRPLQAVVEDAVALLQEALQEHGPQRDHPSLPQHQAGGLEQPAVSRQERPALMRSVTLIQKALGGEDIPMAVKAIVRDASGRVLILRDAYSDYWDLPGGHVQAGEVLENALRREVYEETGLELGECEQYDLQMLQLGSEAAKPVLFYEAQWIGGQPRISEEHIGYQWADDNDLGRLNLGIFRQFVLRTPADTTDPSQQKTPRRITVKEGGGDAGGVFTTGDANTDTFGGGPRRAIQKLVDGLEYDAFVVRLIGGRGVLVTGEDTKFEVPMDREVVKVVKALDTQRLSFTDLRILHKAAGQPLVIAGYASPVVVDQEGHRISHAALAKDLPRFLAEGGRYANVNVLHSNLTVGRVLAQYKAPSGKIYRTEVDDIGLFVVAEVRTDPHRPKALERVEQDIKSGKLKSFSISGNAENPVFTCDQQRCFYDIGDLDLFEITICSEGVNQDAKFDVISSVAY